jgi:hypothetical protein
MATDKVKFTVGDIVVVLASFCHNAMGKVTQVRLRHDMPISVSIADGQEYVYQLYELRHATDVEILRRRLTQ